MADEKASVRFIKSRGDNVIDLGTTLPFEHITLDSPPGQGVCLGRCGAAGPADFSEPEPECGRPYDDAKD